MKLTIGDELAVIMQVEAVNDVIGGSVPAEQAHDRVMCVRFLTLELFAAQGVPLLLDLQTAEDTIANELERDWIETKAIAEGDLELVVTQVVGAQRRLEPQAGLSRRAGVQPALDRPGVQRVIDKAAPALRGQAGGEGALEHGDAALARVERHDGVGVRGQKAKSGLSIKCHQKKI